jgi:hypothetical protein
MKKVVVLAASLAWLGGAVVMSQPDPDDARILASYIPFSAGPWLPEADRVFDAATIFDYIDGAGEVYRAYNMKLLVARRFHKDGRPDIVVDAFDMGSSEDAYGVFTHDLEGEEAGIGQGSVYKAGLLSFWKDRYFLSVYAEEETPETKAIVLDLGRSIAGAVPREGRRPWLLRILPREGLDSGRVRFFRSFAILNYHFFIADSDILAFDRASAAVLAPYGGRDDRSRLLVVEYRQVGTAAWAAGAFRKAYLPDAPGNPARTKNGRWTAFRAVAWYLAVVIDASSAKEAIARLDAVERLLTSSPEREPDR